MKVAFASDGVREALGEISAIRFPVSAWKQTQQELRELIDNQTMGQLAGRLQRELYGAVPDTSGAPDGITEPWFSFSFRLESTAEFVDLRKLELAAVVSGRNDLIHKLLPRWNSDCIESCRSLEAFLDEQCTSIRSEIEHMRCLVDAFREHASAVQEYLQSDAGEKDFDLAWLQQSRIVLMLGDIAKQMARADGWTLLSTAGHVLKTYAPEELGALRTRYKRKSLLDLVIAAELFDIERESTEGGGVRVLYRINRNWTLQ